ncbi:hypothetical protein [Pseudanabaena sp. ABRG5-3]|uniref:VMAP-C domain-containing protein n=1 Tax=Pseudanabaena sp. ABRG5-3 TaxID=685565 RepID=UPI000DC72ED4|nr:hypothetical protein [Pseudanabaena sp. ABRG5-3]BBC26647.1 hypothetical protein ABRG53_a073 [Pseudanabaena sp. ABRG5-3]
MSGDRIEAQESQGLVNNPQGTVKQQFGDRTKANTGGGDFVQGDMDKRHITINIITGSSNAQSQSHLTAEVSKILGGGLDLDAAIASAYQIALPPDASLHPVQADDKISELADRRVLHKFIEILANDRTVSESTRAELQKIISTPDSETSSDRADTTSKKRLRSYLIVVLRPEPNLQFCVNAWLIPDDSVKGSFRFCSLDINEEQKGVVCSLNDIPSVVRSLLDKSLKHLFDRDYDYELTIEFFLPIDYLSTEVDRLEVIPDPLDCDEFNPLGIQYKVVVRSYERLENTYLLHNFQQWKNNWNRADINFKLIPSLDSFEPFTTVNSCNWKKLAMDLKAKLGIKITCVPPEPERKNIFKAILKSAIPIAVWMRKDIRECDRESKLDCLLTSGNLETLPEYIRKEREEAYICDDPEEHFGNHLVLLWEDPNRLTPDVMARLLTTGQ